MSSDKTSKKITSTTEKAGLTTQTESKTDNETSTTPSTLENNNSYTIHHITGKKLYDIVLPAVDSSQIGTFCRENADPTTDQSIQLDPESLSTIKRYDKTKQQLQLEGTNSPSQHPETQHTSTPGSQIDNKLYQEILLNNAQEELLKVQNHANVFDYNKCWKDDDIEHILNGSTPSKDLPIFDQMEDDIKNAIRSQYFHIDSESYKVDDGNTRHNIQKSSQHSRTIIDELMYTCKESINRTTVKFASLELNSVLPKNVYIDEMYPNCITTGLKYLLHKDDRPRLIDCGNMHVHTKYFNICKSRKKYYELYRVLNNHLKSSPTKECIREFFRSIFQNFDEHIDWMMENEEIKIILLVNRENFLNDNTLSLSSIVGGVLYSVQGTIGTCINAIAIHSDYRYNSFGPLLIYLSQILGAYHIEVRCDGSLGTNFQTYLACRKYTKAFYVSLGFKEVDDIEPFKEGGELESFGTHMELPMWIDYKEDDKQIIMSISELCYKMRNYITPNKFIQEDVLYDSQLWTHSHSLFKTPESWKSAVKRTLSRYVKSINEQPLNVVQELLDNENKFHPSRIYIQYQDHLTLPLIGEIFGEICSTFEKKNRKNRGHIIKSSIPSLSALKLRIFQKQKEGGENGDECWCQIECTRCKKVCCVKNTSLDPLVVFLMKCIMSIWYQHVYTFEPVEGNEWNKAYPDWHLCQKRNGTYLERLKISTYGDQEKYDKRNSLTPYFKYVKYLEEFLTEYVISLKDIRKESIIYMCRVWCHEIKKIKEQLQKVVQPVETLTTTVESGTRENQTESSPTESDTSDISEEKKLKRKRKRKSKRNDKKRNFSKSNNKDSVTQPATHNDGPISKLKDDNLWTDSDSDENSDISVNDFGNDTDQIDSLSDAKLKKSKILRLLKKLKNFFISENS